MQRLITSYCQSGGNLFVSGAYVGSDMSGTQGNREFTEKVLKYGYQNSLTDKSSGSNQWIRTQHHDPPPAQ